MGDRRCCCNPGCVQVTDNFDRTDSSTIGNDWEECPPGDWEIRSERLVTDDESIIVWKKMAGPQVGIFTIYLKDVLVGTDVSIIFFYGKETNPCDNTTYWQLRFNRTSSTEAVVQLIDLTGIVVFEDKIVFVYSEIGMSVCVGPERISASTTHSYAMLACWCLDSVGTGSAACDREGWWFGVKNSTAVEIEIDWAYYSDHYSNDIKCPQCLCGCEGECFPEYLCATIRNYDMCTAQEGVTILLIKDQEDCSWKSGPLAWDGCEIELELSGPGNEYDPPVEWGLIDRAPEPSSPAVSLNAQVGSTCVPVYLVFGPYRNYHDSPGLGCPGSGTWICCEGNCVLAEGCPYGGVGCQGTYTIEITEYPGDPLAAFESGDSWLWEDGVQRLWEGPWV